jgi:predicted ATP-grasp superfamily ATP-dependent carboligase
MVDVDAFASTVFESARDAECDLVLPMTDPSMVATLGAEREESADRGFQLPIPVPATYHAASNKAELMELAHGQMIPVPEQVVLGDPDLVTARGFAEHVGWPVVVKPCRSVVRRGNRLVRTFVRLAADPAQLGAALDAVPPEAYPVLVQRRIDGPGLGVFLLAVDGEITAWFAHRRIREKPPTGGVSVYRESIAVREDLARHTSRLAKRLGWTGVAMVEFKEESSTGIPYLMEINARFWGSLQLAIDAGVDFPKLLVEAVLGGQKRTAPEYETGVRSRWLWGDFDHLLWILRASRGYRAVHPYLPSRLGALGRFVVPWRPGDRYEVLRMSDPGPFVRESIDWFSSLRR